MIEMKDFSDFFPNPRLTMENMVAVGGELSPEMLFYAYTHGFFPWVEDPIRWFCLEPRAIFDMNRVNFSKTVMRKIRQNRFSITFNQSFGLVMKACAYRPEEGTWITPGFFEGYQRLHEQGYAHSVEAWNSAGILVGGVYGVAIGKLFAGESMFAFESDAGKIALYHLFEALKKDGFELFDTQELNHVTWNLGAYEISKETYLNRLEKAVRDPNPWKPPQVVILPQS